MATKHYASFFKRIAAIISVIFCGLIFISCQTLPSSVAVGSEAIYQERSIHSPDGIGKFYMGREIAKVMGHEGAAWLERSRREQQERPSLVIAALDLKPTDIVADIGAGTGYFSFRIASLLPEGKVFAVDIQPEMLDIINFLNKEKGIQNVRPILATEIDPNLAEESIDLALMVDAYHEFSYPQEVMAGVVKALNPGGRVALVEYRGEDPLVRIKPLHKMTENQVRQEMAAVGLQWIETKNILPQQHLIIFEKAS